MRNTPQKSQIPLLIGKKTRISKALILLNSFPFKTYQQLHLAFENASEAIYIGNELFPSSYFELSKPTGKYLPRFLLKLLTKISKNGFVRMIGNANCPGLYFPRLQEIYTTKAESLNPKCGLLIANILGNESIPNAIVIQAEPFMVLKIKNEWVHFGDYLNAMNSKYRIRTNKALETSKEYHCQLLSHHEANEWIPQCAKMLGHNLKEKTLVISSNLSAMLHTFSRVLKSDYVVFGYYRNKTLCGFISAIPNKNELYAMHIGLTDEAANNQLYQRMLYDLIGYSITTKKEFVSFGRTATEIKSSMGAVAVENSYAFFSKSTSLFYLVKLYKNYFYKSKKYTLRNPFK